MLVVILLGSPGTGKGTQASRLAERTGWLHLSTGDLLRQATGQNSELGALVMGFMERGELVPDQVVLKLLIDSIKALDGITGLILDGFPRTLSQALALDEALRAMGLRVDAVASITASDAELLRRLTSRRVCESCGAIFGAGSRTPDCERCGGTLTQRDDDRLETAKARLRQQRTPRDLLAYYIGSGKLSEIDGTGEVDAVAEALLRALGPLVPSSEPV